MVISIAYESENDNQEKNWGCYRIFCVGEDFAPPGPGGLGLEKNFFLYE